MSREEILGVLHEMGDILELTEANPFQIMAYRNAVQTLEDWEGDLSRAIEQKTLTDLPGIGKGLSGVISDLFLRGRSEELDRLRDLVPGTLRELLAVPRLGPKKIRLLNQNLGIESLEGLEKAAREGKIRTLKGFGARTEEGILRGIDWARNRAKRS